MLITSAQNPRVKALAELREPRGRRAAGLFLIEGLRELERALDAGLRPAELYVCRDFWRHPSAEAAVTDRARAAGTAVVELAPTVFAKVAAREHPGGLLATVPRQRLALADLRPPPGALVLVVEGVEKPGNLGAILRSADGAGCAAVLVTDPATEPDNPNVVRASQGSLFALPVVVTDNFAAAKWLRAHGLTAVATDPAAAAALWDAPLAGPAAIVLGSEKDGLSPFWRGPEAGVLGVRIPMAGAADSLNVMAAAAIALYEAARQRAAR